MHAAKGTPERDAYEKKLAMMKDAMGAKSFFLPSLGRTDLSIKFHNRMQIASEFLSRSNIDSFSYAPCFQAKLSLLTAPNSNAIRFSKNFGGLGPLCLSISATTLLIQYQQK